MFHMFFMCRSFIYIQLLENDSNIGSVCLLCFELVDPNGG